MVINFDISNRLIELLNESCLSIDIYHFKGAFNLKKSRNDKLNYLYRELIDIQKSNLSSEGKYKLQVVKFAEAYNCNGDLEKGEKFLKLTFDEDKILERLTKAYWQISPIRITRNDNTTVNGLKKFIEKYFSEEPCKEIIVETVLKQEPTEIDIEREFWGNCTSVNEINEFCNVYREHLGKELKEVDEAFYDMDTILFNEDSILYQYFKALRNCGLLSCSERFMEVRLTHIAKAINLMSNTVVKLFRKFRASTTKSIVSINEFTSNEIFLNTICKGIEILQQDEKGQQCSKNIVENRRLEAPFQIFFRSLLKINYECSDIEVGKGTKRIDLKIENSNKLPHRLIIEFKGWWNNDKDDVIEQCVGYLTDFEGSAIIVMINHLQRSIEIKYREKVVLKSNSYVSDSWCELKYKETIYKYFKSEHTINGQTKTIYHFIVSPKIYCKI